MADLPIYYFENDSDVDYIIRKRGIKGILFSRYEDTRLEENRLLEYCKSNDLKTLIAPTISEADSDGNFHQWVRPIKIEDLLGRAEININLRQVAAEFRGKVVLVTGAANFAASLSVWASVNLSCLIPLRPLCIMCVLNSRRIIPI